MHLTPFPSLARAKIAGRAHAESGSPGTVYVLRRGWTRGAARLFAGPSA